MRLFDTHAHLDDEAYNEDREALIAALPGLGVERCVTVGADMASSERALLLARKYPAQLRAAVGVHPSDADSVNAENMDRLSAWLDDPLTAAMGEIGLDYHFDDRLPNDVQMAALEAQHALAMEKEKPVIFHVRDAWGDFMPWLRRTPTRGIMHCFAGSREIAAECLDAGLYVAFGGSSTFKNAHKLREVAAYIPEDRLLLETDCPYLSPEPFRGRRNDPSRTALVAAKLAEVRGTTAEALAEACFGNACRLFGWEE